MPNICDNFVSITGAEEVLCVLEARDFHWPEYFPEMAGERGGICMATRRGDDAPPIRLIRNGDGGIQAYFISAWYPPLEFYNKLVERFSDIQIEYEYHEWRMGFAGFGLAGRGMEPTHFSYESSADIETIHQAHNWHLIIENPYLTEQSESEEALSLTTHSDEESVAQI